MHRTWKGRDSHPYSQQQRAESGESAYSGRSGGRRISQWCWWRPVVEDGLKVLVARLRTRQNLADDLLGMGKVVGLGKVGAGGGVWVAEVEAAGISDEAVARDCLSVDADRGAEQVDIVPIEENGARGQVVGGIAFPPAGETKSGEKPFSVNEDIPALRLPNDAEERPVGNHSSSKEWLLSAESRDVSPLHAELADTKHEIQRSVERVA